MKTIKSNALGIATFCGLALMAILVLSGCKKNEPTSDFTFTVDGATVTFTYTGEHGEDFDWDFGDGQSGTEKNPVHSYAAAGTYSVTLEASNEDGSDSKTQSVVIEQPEAESPELNFGDADGAFYAINTVTVSEVGGFETQINVGTAVAWFVDGGTSFVDVGAVSFSQSNSLSGTLDRKENNVYHWLEDEYPTEGFDKDGGVEWSIAGGNGHAQVNGLSNGFPFPSTKKVDESSESISGGSSYTLRHSGSISNADSTIYSIYGSDANVSKTAAGSTGSVTFSASDMASLGEGYAILQIASFNIYSQTLGANKYYVVNESVASKTVTIE